MTLRRGLSLVVVLLVAAVAAPACSSSSKSDGAAGSQDTTAGSGSCPFSGSTQPQSEPGASGPTTLTGAVPQTDGCIDNVQLKFSPSLAASKFEYESGAPVLVVTLTGAKLGGGLSAGTTQNPKNLNYVQTVVVSAPSGSVKVEITLDEKRPFLVSSSQVPAELELSIG
jgi:hypothetical protein